MRATIMQLQPRLNDAASLSRAMRNASERALAQAAQEGVMPVGPPEFRVAHGQAEVEQILTLAEATVDKKPRGARRRTTDDTLPELVTRTRELAEREPNRVRLVMVTLVVAG